jgi:hypothetical protein
MKIREANICGRLRFLTEHSRALKTQAAKSSLDESFVNLRSFETYLEACSISVVYVHKSDAFLLGEKSWKRGRSLSSLV